MKFLNNSLWCQVLKQWHYTTVHLARFLTHTSINFWVGWKHTWVYMLHKILNLIASSPFCQIFFDLCTWPYRIYNTWQITIWNVCQVLQKQIRYQKKFTNNEISQSNSRTQKRRNLCVHWQIGIRWKKPQWYT